MGIMSTVLRVLQYNVKNQKFKATIVPVSDSIAFSLIHSYTHTYKIY